MKLYERNGPLPAPAKVWRSQGDLLGLLGARRVGNYAASSGLIFKSMPVSISLATSLIYALRCSVQNRYSVAKKRL